MKMLNMVIMILVHIHQLIVIWKRRMIMLPKVLYRVEDLKKKLKKRRLKGKRQLKKPNQRKEKIKFQNMLKREKRRLPRVKINEYFISDHLEPWLTWMQL